MVARVLVVHGVPAMRRVIAQALDEAGCTTIEVEGCHRATELVDIDPPDVIIADDRAVNASPDAFRAMRELFPKVVVVALAPPPGHPARGPLSWTDCEIDKVPDDQQLVRAVRWALRLAEPVAAAG